MGHLSVVKAMFPNGVNVLSLFTGIAGGEACFALAWDPHEGSG